MSETTENVEEKKPSMQVPVLGVTQEDLEKNKKSLENAKSILTPPEGKVLAGLRSFCPIHGDITRASKISKYTILAKVEGTDKVEPITYTDVICLACVSDLWRKGVVAKYPANPDGTPGDIKMAPVFIDKEEYDKLVKEQEAQVTKEDVENMTVESDATTSVEKSE